MQVVHEELKNPVISDSEEVVETLKPVAYSIEPLIEEKIDQQGESVALAGEAGQQAAVTAEETVLPPEEANKEEATVPHNAAPLAEEATQQQEDDAAAVLGGALLQDAAVAEETEQLAGEAVKHEAPIDHAAEPLVEAALEQGAPVIDDTDADGKQGVPATDDTEPQTEEAAHLEAVQSKMGDNLPVREYLDLTVVPILRDGLRLLAKER